MATAAGAHLAFLAAGAHELNPPTALTSFPRHRRGPASPAAGPQPAPRADGARIQFPSSVFPISGGRPSPSPNISSASNLFATKRTQGTGDLPHEDLGFLCAHQNFLEGFATLNIFNFATKQGLGVEIHQR
jgi:hypothetical protein